MSKKHTKIHFGKYSLCQHCVEQIVYKITKFRMSFLRRMKMATKALYYFVS